MISIENSFKKTRVKLELLADINTLLLVKKKTMEEYVTRLINMLKTMINK